MSSDRSDPAARRQKIWLIAQFTLACVVVAVVAYVVIYDIAHGQGVGDSLVLLIILLVLLALAGLVIRRAIKKR